MSIYRRVLRYYRPFWAQTIFGLLLSLVAIGLNLLKPWPFKIIVDHIIPNFHQDNRSSHFFQLGFLLGDHRTAVSPVLSVPGLVGVLCLALVFIQLLWGIINWITNYIFVKIGLEALLKLRTDLYSYLQSLDRFEFSRRLRFAVHPDHL